jgi:hypothetical protein
MAESNGTVPSVLKQLENRSDEVHPEVRHSIEIGHEVTQTNRWERAGRRIPERKRAALLAELELNVLWDGMDDHEREATLKAIEEDREWPELFDRMREERKASRLEGLEDEREANRELAEAEADLATTNRRLIAALEAEERSRVETAEREEAERLADRERRLAEERERAAAAREHLHAEPAA